MDPLTHAALGALGGAGVARVVDRRKVNAATGLGALAGLFPDIDSVTLLFSPLYYHAYWHGTYTHSLLLAPAWALLFALLIRCIQRHSKGPALTFALLYWLGLTGICTHIAADLLTAWDVGVLMPLSNERVSFGLLFIVDPVFSASIVLALGVIYWQARQPNPRLLVTVITLLGPVIWLSFAAVQKHAALNYAKQYARQAAPLSGHAMQAWPQPFSLYHWKLLQNANEGVWAMDLRVSDSDPLDWPFNWMQQSANAYLARNDAEWTFHPRQPTPEAETAWQHPDFQAVRDFMSYPAYLDDNNGCLWFTDLLFVVPQMQPPFQYGLCTHTDGSTRIRRR
ncbi:metal-dependent hydrolase [Aliidiomarina soli]|uniref:Metal-dependent hydrolase n=1 Tax=Aliidiomarina soli TaxID=1928574 RepID=A0A432WIK2_9GAMM|nr:metal-dependent hydrolase [Aliidiomarina soli]RUO33630.1 hypothetical protein CWE14_03965 [Aliidiomarina soli]